MYVVKRDLAKILNGLNEKSKVDYTYIKQLYVVNIISQHKILQKRRIKVF